MERRLLLNVVVGQSATIFQLLPSKNKTLLVRRNTLLILDLCLDIVDGVRGFDLQSNCLAGQGLYEDLHATAETENEVEGGLLLNVVVRKSATILKLLSSEDQALLVRWDTARCEKEIQRRTS